MEVLYGVRHCVPAWPPTTTDGLVGNGSDRATFVVDSGWSKTALRVQNPGSVSLINWSSKLGHSCISINPLLRNAHGNWSVVIDASLLSVGSKGTTPWRDTSKKRDAWNSHNNNMFCIRQANTKQTQDTRRSNPPWMRFGRTGALADARRAGEHRTVLHRLWVCVFKINNVRKRYRKQKDRKLTKNKHRNRRSEDSNTDSRNGKMWPLEFKIL